VGSWNIDIYRDHFIDPLADRIRIVVRPAGVEQDPMKSQSGFRHLMVKKLMRGAIFFVTVPAMIIRSAWRGVGAGITQTIKIIFAGIGTPSSRCAQATQRSKADAGLAGPIDEGYRRCLERGSTAGFDISGTLV